MFGSFAVKLKDKADTDFELLRIHVGTYPWNTEGCVLVGEYFQTNYYFKRSSRSIYKTLSEAEWNVFSAEGMITKNKSISLKKKTKQRRPNVKTSLKYSSPIWDQNGLTDRLYKSKKWLAKLEKLTNKVEKKYGRSCVSYKVTIR